MAEQDLIRRGTALEMLNELKVYARSPAEKRMVRRALWTIARRVPAAETGEKENKSDG